MSTPYDDQSARPGPPAGYPGAGPQRDPNTQPGSQPSDGRYSGQYSGGYDRGSVTGSQGSAQPTAAPPMPSSPPSSGSDSGAQQPVAGFDSRGHVQRGRISTLWITLIVAAIGLILLIVFIAQNSRVVPIHFLGFAGHLAMGLTVLIAAVVGLLLAAIPGTIRIIQLRKALKTNVPKGRRSS